MVDYPDWTRDVDIVAQTIAELDIDIVAQTLAQLDIDIVAQTLAQVNVNIAASAVTFDVNVTGSVAINIQTSGETNIVIDKLTQGAVRGERRQLATSDLGSPDAYQSLDIPRGFTIARGCRGQLSSIYVWLRNNSGSDQTVTARLRPYPDAPDVASGIVTVPDGTDTYFAILVSHVLDLKSRSWLYDQLWCLFDTEVNVDLGVDTSLGDGNGVGYAGGVWLPLRSYMGYAWIGGLTTGDLPISGVVNAVILPDETYKMGGLYLKPEEAARKGTDKNFRATGGPKAWNTSVAITYPVPPGKTLFICGYSCSIVPSNSADYDHQLHFFAELTETGGAIHVGNLGGNGGGGMVFVKPIVYTGAQELEVYVTNRADIDVDMRVSAWGYEI